MITKKRGRPKKIQNNIEIPQNKQVYSVVLEMTGKIWTAQGVTILEALDNLGLSWEQIKNKGVIKVSGEGKFVEHLFQIRFLKRIFANKTFRLIWAKRLGVLMH